MSELEDYEAKVKEVTHPQVSHDRVMEIYESWADKYDEVRIFFNACRTFVIFFESW